MSDVRRSVRCRTCGQTFAAPGPSDAESASLLCRSCAAAAVPDGPAQDSSLGSTTVFAPRAAFRDLLDPTGGPSTDDSPATTSEAVGSERQAEPLASPGGSTTLFQPGAALRDVFDPAEEGASLVADPSKVAGLDAGARVPRPVHPPSPQALHDSARLVPVGARWDDGLRLRVPETVVGGQGADISLPDPTVAARHFAVEVAGNELFIRDLETPTGTFLNGSRIRHTQLLPGDEIRAGETTLVLRVCR